MPRRRKTQLSVLSFPEFRGTVGVNLTRDAIKVEVGQADTTTTGTAEEFPRHADPDGSRCRALFGEEVAPLSKGDGVALAKSGLHPSRVPHPLLPVSGCEEPLRSTFQGSMMNSGGQHAANRRRHRGGEDEVKTEMAATASLAKPKVALKPPPTAMVMVWERDGRYHIPRHVPVLGATQATSLTGFKPATVRMGAGRPSRRQSRSRGAPFMRC